jgi:D-serine deaminase-like pyridoxal phosphate-dependent protein
MTQMWLTHEIDTPAVMINARILKRNLNGMNTFAKNAAIHLRPHIKTHKITGLAHLQIQLGAIGITTAKLAEAEVMAQSGITDILIAYPIVGELKLERLKRLMSLSKITTVVDGVEQASQLSRFAMKNGLTCEILIEVDSGLNRCGVLPGIPVVDLFRNIASMPGLAIKGIMTHAGHAYGASGFEQVREIATQEGKVMVDTAELLQKEGFSVDQISVGATPTVRISGQVFGVTEIRPGNYVFNDMTQVRLGVADVEDCSLRVASRVVGKPTANRLIIDAGAKSLALDQGAHGTKGLGGFGYIVGHPELTITRLSEEHGMVEIKGHCSLAIGDLIEIIPNHSCPVVNLTDSVLVVEDGNVVDHWLVDARGKSQ